MVDGADYFLVCHDDVALFPDAVHLMVEEAFRSNAGIVSPEGRQLGRPGAAGPRGDDRRTRAVRWWTGCSPTRSTTASTTRCGTSSWPRAGARLIRADLFEELGGFDPAIVAMGEDLDLCWRAQVVGARIIVAPDARVRHLEELAGGVPVDRPGAGRGRDEPARGVPGHAPGAAAPPRAPGRLQLLRALPPAPGGAPGAACWPPARSSWPSWPATGPGPGPWSGPGGGIWPGWPPPGAAQGAQGPPAAQRQGDPAAPGGRERPALRLLPAGLPARVPRCPRRRAGRRRAGRRVGARGPSATRLGPGRTPMAGGARGTEPAAAGAGSAQRAGAAQRRG